MIALLQRVLRASVTVNQQQVASIEQGILLFIGVEKADDAGKAARLAQRFLNYRVFADADDKMNLSVQDIQGGVLLVPQFTLAADTRKGNRPSFSSAAAPQQGRALFDELVDISRQQYANISTGVFGADMKIELINDGPVTFWLQA